MSFGWNEPPAPRESKRRRTSNPEIIDECQPGDIVCAEVAVRPVGDDDRFVYEWLAVSGSLNGWPLVRPISNGRVDHGCNPLPIGPATRCRLLVSL